VPTLAEALKPLGYQTAMFGKWHLGLAEGCRPQDHGFDEWFGFMAGCIDYYSHIFYWGMADGKTSPTHDLWENGKEVYDNGRYFTELITERAVDYIRRAVRDGRPFFLYLPYNAPHYPMHAPMKYIDRFPDLPWERQIMAAMLSAVDDSIGEILDELQRQGITDQTCCSFQSDNGPSRERRNWMDGRQDWYYGGSAGAFRGHKFSLFEGGTRSPGIMTYPGRIPAGQVVDEVGVAMDIFPTFLKLAGGDPAQYEVDGSDIWPVVTAGAPTPHRQVFWEMDRQTAVRQGKWKLVLNGQLAEGLPPEDAVHLADLTMDSGETRNLAEVHPELTAELTRLAESWRQGIEERWAREFTLTPSGLTGRT